MQNAGSFKEALISSGVPSQALECNYNMSKIYTYKKVAFRLHSWKRNPSYIKIQCFDCKKWIVKTEMKAHCVKYHK
jgi:hypothetical protein